VISSSQGPLPTQHTREANIHALSGIRTVIPEIKRQKSYALDRTATGICNSTLYYWKLLTKKNQNAVQTTLLMFQFVFHKEGGHPE
jgi:hypothetical protein